MDRTGRIQAHGRGDATLLEEVQGYHLQEEPQEGREGFEGNFPDHQREIGKGVHPDPVRSYQEHH